MAAEQVLELLDSYWFETTILTTRKNPSKVVAAEALPTLEIRSFSDQNLVSSSSTDSIFSFSQSPNSVLNPQKLKTIPSGRDVREFTAESVGNHEKKQSHRHRRRHRRRLMRELGKSSKSLTELEFQELKGFMDLGFVFSEEDKDSRLVSLIPGLQRLGKDQEDDNDEEEEEKQSIGNNKPYLSEAWGFYDQREKMRNPLLNWKVPDKGDEIDMKNNLMFWAHTVASIVE